MKGDLLRFSKKILGIAVQSQSADSSHRHELLRNKLCGVEEIKRELLFILFFNDLHPELPFWKITILDRVPKIAPVEVRIQTRNFLCFIPNDRMHAQYCLPVKFHEPRFPFFIHKSKCED